MVEKCWPKRPLIFPCALSAAIRGTVRTMHRQVRYRGYPAKDYDALSADLFRIFFHYRGRGNPMPHGELGGDDSETAAESPSVKISLFFTWILN
jgi:hypothetical protein